MNVGPRDIVRLDLAIVQVHNVLDHMKVDNWNNEGDKRLNFSK